MAKRRSEFETAIIISGTDKGGIKILEATGDQVDELEKKQKQGAGTAEKYGKKHKESGDKVSKFGDVVKKGIDVVVKAAAAAAAALTGLVTINTKIIAEQTRTAQMLGISTQSFQAQAHMARMAGLDISEYGDVLRDVTVRVREFASIGTGEGADFFEALNLDIQEFKDLAPDELFAAIGQELKDLNRNDRLLFLDQLGSDQATKLVDVIHRLDEMEQEAIAIGVALSDIDAEQVNQAAVGLEKAQSVAAGAANQITAGLAPIVTDLTTRFYDAAVGAGGIESAVDAFVEGALTGIGFVADSIFGLRKLLKVIEIGWLGIASIATQALASNAEGVSELMNLALTPLQALLGKIAEGWAVILYGFSQVPGMPFADSILAASDTLRDFSKDIEGFEVDATKLNALNETTKAGLASARQELQDLLNAEPPSDNLDEWYENVKARAEELAEATLEANQATGESVEVTNKQQAAIESLIDQMEFENSLLGMTTLEQKIQNNLRKAGANATDEQREAIRRLTIERHREEEAIAELKEETDRLAEVQSNQMENFQREFSSKVVDTIKAGRLELESIVDLLKNGLTQGFADFVSAQTTKLFFNQGGTGATGSGGFNPLNLVGLGGGGGLSLSSIGAGVSGFAQGALGFGQGASTFVGPMTQSATMGANFTSFLTGPAGIAVMAAIAGKLIHDATNDPDGRHRGMAGFLGSPTPGAPASSMFNVDPFASGFAPIGFADGPVTQQQANELIDLFRGLDQSIVESVLALGGTVNAPAGMNGFGLEGTGAGTFFGRSDITTDAQFTAQVNAYADQLAEHVEGLDAELIEAIRSAGSAQEVLGLLNQAMQDQTEAEEELEEQSALATAAQLAQARAAEEAAAAEERLAKMRLDIKAEIIKSMQALGDSMQQLNDLRTLIENDIFTAQGISLLGRDASLPDNLSGPYADQLAAIDAARAALIAQYNEQIGLERELHNERMQSYRQQIAIAGRLDDTILNILGGDNSSLSNREKFEMFGDEFDRLAELALGGDIDAAGKVGAVGQDFVEAIRAMFASSNEGDQMVDNVLRMLARIQEKFAGAEDPGRFDPSELNEQLIRDLESLQGRVTDVHDAIATDAVNQLIQLNAGVIALPEQMATAMNLPEVLAGVVAQQREAGVPITVLADQIAQSLVLTDAANEWLARNGGGTVDDYTSANNPLATPDLIQQFAQDVIARHGGVNDAAISEFIETAIANGVGSRQVANALDLDQIDVINLAKRLGFGEFADGAIVDGPRSGFPALLHGKELVAPLPNDFNVADLGGSKVVAEVRELRLIASEQSRMMSQMNAELVELRKVSIAGHEFAGRQRSEEIAELRSISEKTSAKGPGTHRYEP